MPWNTTALWSRVTALWCTLKKLLWNTCGNLMYVHMQVCDKGSITSTLFFRLSLSQPPPLWKSRIMSNLAALIFLTLKRFYHKVEAFISLMKECSAVYSVKYLCNFTWRVSHKQGRHHKSTLVGSHSGWGHLHFQEGQTTRELNY